MARPWRAEIFALPCVFAAISSFLRRVHGLYQIRQRLLGVAVKHFAIWFKEEWIDQSGEALPLASL
jgi:hypothetical protein